MVIRKLVYPLIKSVFFLKTFLLLEVALNSSQTLAQQAKIDSSAPDINQLTTTTDILTKACTFLKNHQSFSVEMDITYDNVLTTGEKVQYSAYQNVQVNKPNLLRSEYIGDERHTEFYYDGKAFTLYSPQLNFYATQPTETTIDETVTKIEIEYGFTIPLSNLFITNPCTKVLAEGQQYSFIGSNMVNRKNGYHILLIGEERDIQMWISQQEPPLLLKTVITYKNLPASPQYTAIFSNWNFTDSIPNDTFNFNPPEDASYIEFLPAENN